MASLSAALFDLSDRVKLRVSGADCERFLNGQFTNDVCKATATEAIQACALTAKGKMNALLFLVRDSGGFLLDAEPEMRDSLQLRLERYIIADDVQIVDESNRWGLFHLLGATAAALPNELNQKSSKRFRGSGLDLWVDAARHHEWLNRLSQDVELYDSDRADVFRIEQGLPRWGRELNDDIIPVEANLADRTIDYEKGCYVGQEVISRMKMSGQTNKRLCGLISVDQAPLASGMRLWPIGEVQREIGVVTSAATSVRLGRDIALGYVKRGFNQSGTRLHATPAGQSGEPLPVEIVDLPF